MKIFNKRDLSIRPKMLKLLSGNREKNHDKHKLKTLW